MDREEFFLCDCHHHDHLMGVGYFDAEKDPDWDFVYVEMLVNKGNLWYRIKTALRYILNLDNSYGLWHEILLTRDDAVRLRDVIEEFLHKSKDGG